MTVFIIIVASLATLSILGIADSLTTIAKCLSNPDRK